MNRRSKVAKVRALTTVLVGHALDAVDHAANSGSSYEDYFAMLRRYAQEAKVAAENLMAACDAEELTESARRIDKAEAED